MNEHPITEPGLVDLHSHTNESDGTFTPAELIAAASAARLSALAITDHDTFSGYDIAKPLAAAAKLQLICGIELNSKLVLKPGTHRSAHVLAYFPGGQAGSAFLEWLQAQRAERRQRNSALAERLQNEGMDVTLEEVERLGRSLAGRPHFAKLLVKKGYATDTEEAFQRFIGEEAPTFVDRQSPTTETVIDVIRGGGGIPVLAHPVRLWLSHDATEERVIQRLAAAGLIGLEVAHSDQDAALQAYYQQLAKKYKLLPSGGSDFHGDLKPDIQLGSGRNGNVQAPRSFLDGLLSANIAVTA